MSPRWAAWQAAKAQAEQLHKNVRGRARGARLRGRIEKKEGPGPLGPGKGRVALRPYIEGGDLPESLGICFISLKLEPPDEEDEPPPEGVLGLRIIR